MARVQSRTGPAVANELIEGIPITSRDERRARRINSDGLSFAARERLPLDSGPTVFRQERFSWFAAVHYTGDSALDDFGMVSGPAPGYRPASTPFASRASIPRSTAHLSTVGARLRSRSRASELPSRHLNAEDLCDVDSAFPTLPAQRAIADYLDAETARIDALIEKKRRMVELLEERFGLHAIDVDELGDVVTADVPLDACSRRRSTWQHGQVRLDDRARRLRLAAGRSDDHRECRSTASILSIDDSSRLQGRSAIEYLLVQKVRRDLTRDRRAIGEVVLGRTAQPVWRACSTCLHFAHGDRPETRVSRCTPVCRTCFDQTAGDWHPNG